MPNHEAWDVRITDQLQSVKRLCIYYNNLLQLLFVANLSNLRCLLSCKEQTNSLLLTVTPMFIHSLFLDPNISKNLAAKINFAMHHTQFTYLKKKKRLIAIDRSDCWSGSGWAHWFVVERFYPRVPMWLMKSSKNASLMIQILSSGRLLDAWYVFPADTHSII